MFVLHRMRAKGHGALSYVAGKRVEALFDEAVLASCERATAAAAEVLRLRKRSALVFTGCGTSGRIAFLTARRFNALQGEECCAYLISGGDSALLLSNELPEDDPVAGAAELAAIARGRAAVMLFGVSCGLSAPYVAGQLDHALASPQPADSPLAEGGIAAAAVGFNPASLSRRTPLIITHAASAARKSPHRASRSATTPPTSTTSSSPSAGVPTTRSTS